MNIRQVELVRHSFALVQPIAGQAAALFYRNLFAADPRLRSLFRGDMAQQGERLMGMIGNALSLLDRPTTLMPLLRRLGACHADYGVQAGHYATVGAALLKTLHEGLGEAFTAEAREAWVELYGAISQAMQAGAREPLLAA